MQNDQQPTEGTEEEQQPMTDAPTDAPVTPAEGEEVAPAEGESAPVEASEAPAEENQM